MQPTKVRLKQLFQINNNQTAIEQRLLAIRIGKAHCCFCVSNKDGSRISHLQYYTITDWNKRTWQQLLTENEILGEDFFEIIIAYDFAESLLVPLSVYKNENTEALLQTAFGYVEETTIIAENISGWQLQNIYAVPEEIAESMKKQFPTARYWHQHSVSVKNLDIADHTKKILIDFRKDDFVVLVTRSHDILLARSFAYVTATDVLYHLLRVANEFYFSQEKVHLLLSGLIDRDSSLFKDLKQYFLHIDFREVGWTENGEYPAHYFTSLNDLIQCVS